MKVNRNIFWTKTFANELASLGLEYACISPGSRNAPLTIAFAECKKIKSFPIIDERSCGFFGLGLAKSIKKPVVLIGTSGTAAVEFYPAIVEAKLQRIPLIVCTADRPPELLDCGANQTINQQNVFANHISWFFDAGLPEVASERVRHIKVIARRAYFESNEKNRGPVHLNFPFRKPFEPFSFTDSINPKLLQDESYKTELLENTRFQCSRFLPLRAKALIQTLSRNKRGIIIAGPDNYESEFISRCVQLSRLLGYPILADGASQFRFGPHSKINIISNYDAFLRGIKFQKKIKPDIILQFGRNITSKGLGDYLDKCSAKRFIINKFGDWIDPAGRATDAIAIDPGCFCDIALDTLDGGSFRHKNEKWIELFRNADEIAKYIKKKHIESAGFSFEGRIVSELLKFAPDNSALMLSNSMPIRDWDYYASAQDKNIETFNNRGASGIDGVISTAFGVAEGSGKRTFLLIGDLAFFYDLTGLFAAQKHLIPLTIILINNNGGGIFETLPISKCGDVFKKYFIAPHSLSFGEFVKAFDGSYALIKSWTSLQKELRKTNASKLLRVLEIKTNAKKSSEIRKDYIKKVEEGVNEILRL